MRRDPRRRGSAAVETVLLLALAALALAALLGLAFHYLAALRDLYESTVGGPHP